MRYNQFEIHKHSVTILGKKKKFTIFVVWTITIVSKICIIHLHSTNLIYLIHLTAFFQWKKYKKNWVKKQRPVKFWPLNPKLIHRLEQKYSSTYIRFKPVDNQKNCGKHATECTMLEFSLQFSPLIHTPTSTGEGGLLRHNTSYWTTSKRWQTIAKALCFYLSSFAYENKK